MSVQEEPRSGEKIFRRSAAHSAAHCKNHSLQLWLHSFAADAAAYSFAQRPEIFFILPIASRIFSSEFA